MPRNRTSSAVTVKAGQRRLPPLLRRAWYGLNQAFRRRIAHLGITPDQYSILRWLHEGDPRGLTQREIADLMASDPNTITSILGRMERSGLISRNAHETDRRARRIRIKTAGERALSQGQEIAKELQRQVLSSLPEPKLKEFLKHLEIVADACQQAIGEKDSSTRNN